MTQQDKSYESQALRILLKEFRKISRGLPFNLLTADNARTLIGLTANEESFQKALFKVHMTIAKHEGRLDLKRLAKFGAGQKRLMPSAYPLFNEALQAFLIEYYRLNGGQDIKILTDTYKDAVIAEIQKAQEQFLDLDQLTDAIKKAVTSPTFYRWQAMRIAVTETTFAVNAARDISGEFSTIVMQKEWVTRGDSRVRHSHLIMNGKRVDRSDYFELEGGVKLKYPGDKEAFTYNTASTREVLSQLVFCRCRFNNRPKRDLNGDFIFTD